MRDLRAVTTHVSVSELLATTAAERPDGPLAARVALSPEYRVTAERVDTWLDRGQITTAAVSFSRDNSAAPLSLMSSDVEVQGRRWPFLISADKARLLVKDGHTMVLSCPELWEENLRRMSLETVEAMVASLNTMIFLTPPGTSGFHQHRDRDDYVVVVQTEGTKIWRLYDAPPHGWTEDDDTRPAPESLSAEVKLEVGDTLVIPRGWGHAASADPSTLSIHLSFGINYVSPAHMLRVALINTLRNMRESATLEETQSAYLEILDEFENSDADALVKEFISAQYRTGDVRLRDIAGR
ncbi:hypothetical protein GCM10010191_07140 [Actinomadura vinacea]|uniref:JmjC domain-containing protein n=1 Tax=Actinomadura vinacea TaxID=115336 RepID=A0ABN3IE33_9ACTN